MFELLSYFWLNLPAPLCMLLIASLCWERDGDWQPPTAKNNAFCVSCSSEFRILLFWMLLEIKMLIFPW
jgi:hypothetical protein